MSIKTNNDVLIERNTRKQRNDSIKEEYLILPENTFFYGYSKATMDELAAELHMSKKPSINSSVANNFYSSLLSMIFQDFHVKINRIINSKGSGSKGVNVFKKVMALVQNQTSQCNMSAFEDIQKNNKRHGR